MGWLQDKVNGIIESIFEKTWDWIVTPFTGLRPFDELVFGKDGDVDLAYGIFTSDELTNIFEPGLQAFFALAITVLLVGIILGGMRISSAGINPSNRTYVLEFFRDLIFVGIVLFNLSTLYHLLFGLNYTIVSLFDSSQENLFDFQSGIDTGSGGVLGTLIINLILLGLALWANFYYMMRKISLLILMIMGPLMVTFYLTPQTRNISMAWLKELIGTVLVQSVHAALYWITFLIGQSTSGIESLVLYVTFIPIAESLKALFGLSSDMTGRMSRTFALFGGGALAGILGSVKSALDGKSVTETIRSLTEGFKNRKQDEGETEDGTGILNNAGTDVGSTTLAERMLKSGEIMSKAGKAIFGSAGAIAGSPMGPLASIIGSQAGSTIGGGIGGLTGRVANAGIEGIKKRLKAGVDSAVETNESMKNAEELADEKVAEAIAEDETIKWANENKDEFLADLKQRFPDATDEQLAQLWDKELSGKRAEFLDKARSTVAQIKSDSQPHANAEDLVNSSVDNLTDEWAKNNKDNFIKEYDKFNPLPENATIEDIQAHQKNRDLAWEKEVARKRASIQQIANETANNLLTPSSANTESFVNKVGEDLSEKLGIDKDQAVAIVKNSIGSQSNLANANSLVEKTVDSITNDWANRNKEQFFKDYDEKNPLPENATTEDIVAHHKNRDMAWNNELAQKRASIQQITNDTAASLINPIGKNRELYANKVGEEISEKLGLDKEQAISLVKNSISGQSNLANATTLVNKTVDSIANDWASRNKEQFFKEYDEKNPLPENATTEEVLHHQQSRELSWNNTLKNTRDAIRNIAGQKANELLSSNAASTLINKEAFTQKMAAALNETNELNLNPEHIHSTIQEATSGVPSVTPKFAKTDKLINQTVDNLTNHWATNNKEQFMHEYDNNNPLPSNYTHRDVTQHRQNRDAAWQQQVATKRQEFKDIVENTASQMTHKLPSSLSYIDKESFARQIVSEVSNSIEGMNDSIATEAVEQASHSVPNVSLYSGKSVNRDFLVNRLAEQRTQQGKEQFISEGLNNGTFNTRQEALQHWTDLEAPKRFNEHFKQIDNNMPQVMNLSHSLPSNSIIKNASSRVVGVTGSFISGVTGAKEIQQFLADTKVGQALQQGLHGAYQEAITPLDYSQGTVSGIQNKITNIVQEGVSQGVNAYKNHIPSNVVEKQAGFRNIAAYSIGMIGGVTAYKRGAKLGMKFNPYNNLVNQQIAEMSEINQMVQSVVDPQTGVSQVANGAIRMVTSNDQTILQVRDKTGNLQTVSRISTGDSSLKPGQFLYQDLTIKNGQFEPVSNVYKEDSGGGKIAVNRRININPNMLVANRNTPSSPRIVNEVQSYNQFVDSGEYYLKDAVKEMENIQMVVDRNHSYLVGHKNGKKYRISPYGPGDARLQTNEIVYRDCAVQNKKLKVIDNIIYKDGEVVKGAEYTSSFDPNALIQSVPPNKRFEERQRIEQYRHKAFTEPLR